MISRIRAIAIDDEAKHLEHIGNAAKAARIGCLPLLYPTDTSAEDLAKLNLAESLVRVVICDLHLDFGAQTGNGAAAYAAIGALLLNMKMPAWAPYILVLWTKCPEEKEKLREYLEEKLDPKFLPNCLVCLDKTKYGVGAEGGEVNEPALWNDLLAEIHASNGLNLLMQWEAEILDAADTVLRDIVRLARANPADGKPIKKIDIGQPLDRVVSLIAQTSTSQSFAQENPRGAANEGLVPLLVDSIQHLSVSGLRSDVWDKGLSLRNQKLETSDAETAFLNDAFLFSRTDEFNGGYRGAVVEGWHDDAEFASLFGKPKNQLADVFGIQGGLPNPLRLRYVQIEGACDSVQQKKGLVPFVLACEVSKAVEIKSSNNGAKSRPASVEVSPIYPDSDGNESRLIINFRYFFTLPREQARTKRALFRVREALIAKWAFSWATHAIRPGIVNFDRP